MLRMNRGVEAEPKFFGGDAVSFSKYLGAKELWTQEAPLALVAQAFACIEASEVSAQSRRGVLENSLICLRGQLCAKLV
jgi:hypothetical protein